MNAIVVQAQTSMFLTELARMVQEPLLGQDWRKETTVGLWKVPSIVTHTSGLLALLVLLGILK